MDKKRRVGAVKSKVAWAVPVVLGVLFGLCSHVMQSDGELRVRSLALWVMCLAFPAAFCLLFWVCERIVARRTSCEALQGNGFVTRLRRLLPLEWRAKNVLVAAAVIFLLWTPSLIALYPGVVWFDTSSQIVWFTSPDPVSLHHPLFVTVLLGSVVNGAGEILGDGYSVAWRILDASKGWGVAQRRRRIFAVLDLGGACAGPVLFESEGLSGYSPPGETPGQGTPGGPESRAGASGFCTEHSADSRGIGYGEEESPTLRAGVVPGVAIEYNPSDCRLKVKEDGVCQTLTARCGTGGNNVPLTIGEPTVYGICSDQSHSMLSGNPHSGIYEAETSRTLDCNGGSPVCNQGGMAVVETYAIQGNMIGREEKNGPQGGGVNEEVSFTLNTVDRHAVCMHTAFYESTVEMVPALMARDYKDPPIVNPEYLVRRLTPLECCRLQGYPDGWCKGLESADPAEEEISRWEKVFAAWDAVQGKRKPKTRKQIINWLRHPNTDAAEYKAYGNSVAVPCVFFILAGIVWAAGRELSE